MKIFFVAPKVDGYPVANKAGDKKLKKYLESQFSMGTVILLHRSDRRKAIQELSDHRVIFLNDEEAVYFQLTANKDEFQIQEVPEEKYSLL